MQGKQSPTRGSNERSDDTMPRFDHHRLLRATALAAGALLAADDPAIAAEPASKGGPPLPYYLKDRGPGMSTSQFGTYIEQKEWLVYPFFEYTLNNHEEYKPTELGFNDHSDQLGKLTESEALIYVAYGLGDRMMFEIEPAYWTSAKLKKASDDPSNQPEEIKESGFGDLDMQFRWRWTKESERRPELFSFF